jgi:Ribonuclease G/E
MKRKKKYDVLMSVGDKCSSTGCVRETKEVLVTVARLLPHHNYIMR